MKENDPQEGERLESIVLDLSEACERPGRVMELIEKARDAVTDKYKADLTEYEAELEYEFLKDRGKLKNLENYLLENYMPSNIRKGNSCGCWGSAYKNNDKESPVLDLLTRVKTGNSTLAKVGRKTKGKKILYQLGEPSPALKDLERADTYSLKDILAARFVLKELEDVEEMAETLWNDEELRIKDKELIDKPDTGYQAVHMTVMYQGIAIDLHLITEDAFKKSLKDGYHGNKKYDQGSLRKPYLLAQKAEGEAS